jgi:2-dehydro-3-deoxyphosphogalactonate aldolase
MELTPWLARCSLIAILRGVRPDEVVAIGQALARAGIAIVEVPLNSPQPIDSIRRLARSFGDQLLIGAGTVMTAAQVGETATAGGKLIVTRMPMRRSCARRSSGGFSPCPGASRLPRHSRCSPQERTH